MSGKRNLKGLTVIDLYNGELATAEALEIMGPEDYPSEHGGEMEYYSQMFCNAVRLDTLREVLEVLGIAEDAPAKDPKEQQDEPAEAVDVDKWESSREPLADILANYAYIYEHESILPKTVLPAIYDFLQRIKDINSEKLAGLEIECEGLQMADTPINKCMGTLDDLQRAFHGHGCADDPAPF